MYKCPVCFLDLVEDPYISLDICSRCNTKFGIDDAEPEIVTEEDLKECHIRLREIWLLSLELCLVCADTCYSKLCGKCLTTSPKCAFCILPIAECLCNVLIERVLSEELDQFPLFMDQSIEK